MKKTITTILFSSLFLIATAQVNLDQGLIACYLLDGTFADSTSNALDLTATGSPVGIMDRFGNLPGAYNFDALNGDYLTSALDPLMAPSELTLSAWVKLSDPMTDQKIAGRAGVGAGGYLMGVDTNKIDAEIWDMNTTHFRIKGGNVPANTWTHLAISFKANDYLKIYVNGQVVDSMPSDVVGAGTSGTITFTVAGAPWQPTALNVTGGIDDIFLYNRVINSDEMMALYTFITSALNGKSSVQISKMYPVPVNDGFLSIDFSNHVEGDVLVKITDAQGKSVLTQIFDNPIKENLNLSAFAKGIYSVSLLNNDKIETHQIIIQ